VARAWRLAYLAVWTLPPLAGLAGAAYRLAREDDRGPGWPVAGLAALGAAPVLAGTLLVAARLVDALSPLAAPLALLLAAAASAGAAGLALGLAHPRAARLRVPVAVGSGLVALAGLAAGSALLGLPAGETLLALVLGLPLVGLATGAPGAARTWLAEAEDPQRRLAPAALAALLVLATVAGGGFALAEAATGNATGPATHRLAVQLEPSGEGAYRVNVPLPAADGPDPVLEVLRERIEVADGEADLERPAPDRLTVEADGSVRLAAAWSFYGSIGHREAFTDWRLADPNATRTDAGPDEVTVDWRLAAVGGPGHTCETVGLAEATLAPGEAAPLAPADPDREVDTDRPWSVLCN
jgi:hypothetical protein